MKKVTQKSETFRGQFAFFDDEFIVMFRFNQRNTMSFVSLEYLSKLHFDMRSIYYIA